MELPKFSRSDILMSRGQTFKEETGSSEFHKYQNFLKAFHKLFWFSYRKDFPSISPSPYTSDVGWGCMLRSGQMMLAHALQYHSLQNIIQDTEDGKQLILRSFEDSSEAPFSIHRISQLGTKYGKEIGVWYGPSTIAQTISDLIGIHMNDSSNSLVAYVAKESSIYLDEITSVCSKSNLHEWSSVFIIIPLRLGLENINPIYIPQLKFIFTFPQTLGIIGGKPRAAVYFVAFQDDYLFYLDPHTVQPYVKMNDKFSDETFHCPVPRKVSISAIDPSLALGFYCKTKSDLDDFLKRVQQLSENEHPLFTLGAEAPDYLKKEEITLEQFEEDVVIL